MSNAFKLDGSGTLIKSSAVASDTIKRAVVSTISEYANNLKAFADFNYNGWRAFV